VARLKLFIWRTLPTQCAIRSMTGSFKIPVTRSPGFDPKPAARRLVETKTTWAHDRTLPVSRPLSRLKQENADENRPALPPGQSIVTRLPVLDLGYRPLLSHSDWSLLIGGLCRHRTRLSFDDLEKLGPVETRQNVHCVTGWSQLDVGWTGIPASRILDLAQPVSRAHYAILRSFDGYGTSMLLSDLRRDGVIFATHLEGRPLPRNHGGPVRLVTPHLYFWKSAKWVKQIWFTDQDPGGYWENRGYHHRGDPWKQQRFR